MVITIKDENNRFGARVSGIIYNKVRDTFEVLQWLKIEIV